VVIIKTFIGIHQHGQRPPSAPTKSKTKAKNITDKSMGESGLLYVCKGQKDSISQKAVLYETAFIHAIPFSTKD
jgi:hypothetical protein